MTRLKDIAQVAGVSVMTVSKALRNERDVSAATRARIKTLAQQMGYVPDRTAQGLRTHTTRLLGLVLPSLANPIWSRVLLGIEEGVEALGYDLLLAYTHNLPEREETCIRRLLARRVDGLFVSPVYRLGSEAPVYAELAVRRCPVVVLGHPALFCAQFPSVATDDLAASQAMTRHLLGLGHKRIAFLAGPTGSPWSQERFEGYRRALREAGLDVDDRLVYQAGRTVEDGQNAALQMLKEGSEATAIEAVNDLVATGAAEVLLKDAVGIPGQMSLTGFGDTMLSEHFRVPLTTINQPKHRLGSAAVDMMVHLLRGEKVDSRRLPAELVVRESSGTAPATPVLRRIRTP